MAQERRDWLSKANALQKRQAHGPPQHAEEKLKNMLREKREQSTVRVPGFQPG